jgi:hypothetical protein
MDEHGKILEYYRSRACPLCLGKGIHMIVTGWKIKEINAGKVIQEYNNHPTLLKQTITPFMLERLQVEPCGDLVFDARCNGTGHEPPAEDAQEPFGVTRCRTCQGYGFRASWGEFSVLRDKPIPEDK